MKYAREIMHWMLVVGCVCITSSAIASTMRQLHAAGHVELRTYLSPAQDIVPGQKVSLVVEVATDSWFVGGTRLYAPEVPGLVILQNDRFASNATELRGGQTWVLQRWTLDVFAQRKGNFRIPPVRVHAQVSDGSAGAIAGDLYTAPAALAVSVPPALASAPSWVAAPAFSVTQHFDRDVEALQVGDAVQREIVVQATEVMAMMLPVPEVREAAGLAVYPAPPKLENRNNRGATVATRTQQISYVAEEAGQFILPAQEFFWWDTARRQLQLVTLSRVDIVVGGIGAVTGRGSESTFARSLEPGIILAALVFIVGLLALLRDAPRARVRAYLGATAHRIRALRKPALGEHLNPYSRR